MTAGDTIDGGLRAPYTLAERATISSTVTFRLDDDHEHRAATSCSTTARTTARHPQRVGRRRRPDAGRRCDRPRLRPQHDVRRLGGVEAQWWSLQHHGRRQRRRAAGAATAGRHHQRRRGRRYDHRRQRPGLAHRRFGQRHPSSTIHRRSPRAPLTTRSRTSTSRPTTSTLSGYFVNAIDTAVTTGAPGSGGLRREPHHGGRREPARGA